MINFIRASLILTVASFGTQVEGQAPARHDYTDADVQFVNGMIMHHAQAVVMSQWAATHGARPDVVVLCNRIALSQLDEIAVMQHWLEMRGLTAPDPLHLKGGHAAGPIVDASPMHMPGMDMSAMPMIMAGMLSTEEMQALDAARGSEFDRLYLTGMIKHHGGAITMVADLFATPGSGQQADLFGLATDVDAGQRVEIARMQAMLNTINSHPS